MSTDSALSSSPHQAGSAEALAGLLTGRALTCPHFPKYRPNGDDSKYPNRLGFFHTTTDNISYLDTSKLCSRCCDTAVPDGFNFLPGHHGPAVKTPSSAGWLKPEVQPSAKSSDLFHLPAAYQAGTEPFAKSHLASQQGKEMDQKTSKPVIALKPSVVSIPSSPDTPDAWEWLKKEEKPFYIDQLHLTKGWSPLAEYRAELDAAISTKAGNPFPAEEEEKKKKPKPASKAPRKTASTKTKASGAKQGSDPVDPAELPGSPKSPKGSNKRPQSESKKYTSSTLTASAKPKISMASVVAGVKAAANPKKIKAAIPGLQSPVFELEAPMASAAIPAAPFLKWTSNWSRQKLIPFDSPAETTALSEYMMLADTTPKGPASQIALFLTEKEIAPKELVLAGPGSPPTTGLVTALGSSSQGPIPVASSQFLETGLGLPPQPKVPFAGHPQSLHRVASPSGKGQSGSKAKKPISSATKTKSSSPSTSDSVRAANIGKPKAQKPETPKSPAKRSEGTEKKPGASSQARERSMPSATTTTTAAATASKALSKKAGGEGSKQPKPVKPSTPSAQPENAQAPSQAEKGSLHAAAGKKHKQSSRSLAPAATGPKSGLSTKGQKAKPAPIKTASTPGEKKAKNSAPQGGAKDAKVAPDEKVKAAEKAKHAERSGESRSKAGGKSKKGDIGKGETGPKDKKPKGKEKDGHAHKNETGEKGGSKNEKKAGQEDDDGHGRRDKGIAEKKKHAKDDPGANGTASDQEDYSSSGGEDRNSSADNASGGEDASGAEDASAVQDTEDGEGGSDRENEEGEEDGGASEGSSEEEDEGRNETGSGEEDGSGGEDGGEDSSGGEDGSDGDGGSDGEDGGEEGSGGEEASDDEEGSGGEEGNDGEDGSDGEDGGEEGSDEDGNDGEGGSEDSGSDGEGSDGEGSDGDGSDGDNTDGSGGDGTDGGDGSDEGNG
ncbi:hypothetical protein QBC43DRAFT_328190, partial [Cladorrhinum sp. PSN259]